jgi:hypothetical protein
MENQNPHLESLLKQYARDLNEIAPSRDLDARVEDLVAGHRFTPAVVRRQRRLPFYAAAAGLVALAIGVGVFIGMELEHAREDSVANLSNERDGPWPPADLAMWPTDSVSFQIPAEYSAQGTLVAVDPDSKHEGTRYWIDVVVSNDGTFRIERIVPAEPAQKKGGRDGAAPKIQ